MAGSPRKWATPVEEWRPTVGFAGRYEVSNLGRVRSLINGGRILKPKQSGGYVKYLRLNLCPTPGVISSPFVHLLVLETFCGPRPPDHEARHLDGDSLNNQLDNLKWGTKLENGADRRTHGTNFAGAANVKAKVTEIEVRAIRRQLSVGISYSRIGQSFGLSKAQISKIALGQSWGHVK